MNARFVLCLLSAFALGSMATPATAADLTVRFTGKFVESSCSFSVPDVELGSYTLSYFNAVRQSPWVKFQITASACTTDVSTIHIAFTGNTAHPSNSQLYAIANIPGLGVEVQNMSGANATPNVAVFDWSTGTSGLAYPMQARLSRVGTVTTGTIEVPVTVTFTYN